MSCKARTTSLGLALLAFMLLAQTAGAVRLNGLLKLGAISKEEEAGNLAGVQETYNIHDGFALSRILLDGQLGERSFLLLDVQNINQDSRQALLNYRLAGLGQLRFQHDERRQLFDADGRLTSERQDWHLDATVTPVDWLRVTANTNLQTREGERLDYPTGYLADAPDADPPGGFPGDAHEGWLGQRYDYTLTRYQLEAEVQKSGRGFAIGYEGSDFEDELLPWTDRRGQVFSARLFAQDILLPFDMTHSLRGAYGSHELSETGLEHELQSFQYIGTARPHQRFQLRYLLHLNRIEDEAADLQTDYVRNEGRLTYHHRYGRVFGGYGYETNDDDGTLTDSHFWEVGAALHYQDRYRARVRYATRDKNDQEDLTLLKDVEDTRFDAKLQAELVEGLAIGAAYDDRARTYPVLGVEVEGTKVSGFGRLVLSNWASVQADYGYAVEDYDDRAGGFETESHTVAGRVQLRPIPDLGLESGLTYLDFGKDLDIEKSILMFAAQYDLLEDYFLEVKYNIYNYDDYILLDRYYTANIVWVNVGYRFGLE